MKILTRWIMLLALVVGAPTWASAQGVLLYNNPVTGAGGDGYLSLNNKYASVLVEVTITTTATVTFFISAEGAQPTAVACTDVSSTAGTAATSATATGSFICPANGATAFKATVGAHTDGVRVFASPSAGSAKRGGGGGGSGTVTSVSASGGVETASGSAITGSGTIRGNMCVNAQTGTTYTVVSGDRGCLITFSNAGAVDVTVPQAGTAGFDAGFYFLAVNLGAGTVTLTPTTSTIQGNPDLDVTTNRGAVIVSDATNYFVMPGMGLTSETQGLAQVAANGKSDTTANSFANAWKFLDSNGDGFAIYTHATNGPTFVCVDNNVENACTSYTRTLASGQTLVYKNSGGTAIFTLTESTNALTLGGQLITSGSGIEFTESDSNPTCAAGNYNIYADTSETKLKKCVNGTATDLTGGTLTNVTLDGEGTGNTITLTEERHWRVATVQAGVAQAVFDLDSSNTPAPTADVGTNTTKAYLAFDATTDESFQDSWILPTGFTGAIDVHFRWKAAATSGAVGWCAQLIRVPDAATSDPAFPAQAAGNCVSDTAKGTTLQENTATISGVTCTSCAAGDHVYVRISRDADGGAVTDDMTGDALLLTYGRTWRVAH